MQYTIRTAELELLGSVTVACSPEGVLSVQLGSHADGVAALVRRYGHPGTELRSDLGDTVLQQLEEYAAGCRTQFDLPLALGGTPFQHDVWSAVAEIPFGETRTYSQVAAIVGRPRAVRASGAANGANPLCILIPCHRVIGADGSLTGYAYGLALKERLLAFETSIASRLAVA